MLRRAAALLLQLSALRPAAAVFVSEQCFPWSCIEMCKADANCDGIVYVADQNSCTFRVSMNSCNMVPASNVYVAFDLRPYRTGKKHVAEYFPSTDIPCPDYTVGGQSFVEFSIPDGCMDQIQDAYSMGSKAGLIASDHGAELNLAGGLGSRQSMIKWGLFFWGFGMALVVGGLFTYHVVSKGASHLGPADLRVI